jgi:inositol-phosphate transport system ATP-binding protein
VFVAGFIGSPPINLLEGEGRGTTLRVGEMVVPFEKAITGSITFGIRPESVALGKRGMISRIDEIEPHGRETIYHLSTPLGPLRALEAGTPEFNAGDQTQIEIERALIFDHTGRRVGHTTQVHAA